MPESYVPPADDRHTRIPRRALAVILALTAPFFVWGSWHYLATRTDSTYPESCNVHHAMELSAGRSIYPDYRTGPHVANIYGPVSFVLPALACSLGGGGEFAARLGGRLQSLLALLLAAALVFRETRRRARGDTVAALLATGLLTLSPLFFRWSASARPDLPASLLSMCGVLLVAGGKERRRLLAAGALFVLAAFTKQTQIAGAGAVFLWCLMSRERRRRGLALGAGVAGAGLLGVLLLHAATGGLSTLNLIGANTGQLGLRWGLKTILKGLVAGSALMLPAAIVCLRAARARRFGLLHLYFLLSTAWATLTALKTGSSHNYFFEPAMAAALLTGDALSRDGERTALRRAAAAAAALCALLYLVKPVTWLAGRDEGVRFGPLSSGRVRFPDYPETRRRAREAKGPVLVTEGNSELRCGKPPLCLDWFAHGCRLR